MIRAKLKTPEGRKFLGAAGCVYDYGRLRGPGNHCRRHRTVQHSTLCVDDQHVCPAVGDDLRLQPVFTVLLAIPLGIFFLGGRDKH